MAQLILRDGALLLPAFCTAHSHAFQRAMRGQAQRPGPAHEDDFWTWRSAMYDLALSLTPERFLEITRVAFRELRAAGTYTVGEFHYVHHQPDGAPYEQRTLLSDLVVEAARLEGVRVSLLRSIYHRAGPGRPPEHAQRRFSDARLEDALLDVETLLARYLHDPLVRVGIAPHSVRAIPSDWLPEIAAFAARHSLPLHMHVSEQPGEIETCLAETGKRPVELLADRGMLSERFVAVHATHLLAHEARLLGEAHAVVCLNPTTERDLGDGHPDLSALRENHVRLCNGIDSHIMTDPFEEMRGIEYGERLRTLRRVTDRVTTPPLAERLWDSASTLGAQAVGFKDAGALVKLDPSSPTLALVDQERLLDALVFAGSPSLVRGLMVPEAP